jgi:signal transduction histidine kinase
MLRWQLRDVTEQWKATEALRVWNEELERRVRQRTAELEKAEQLLKERDRRKDEFLAVLAHELRNTLTPVRYASHALQQKIEVHPDARRAVDTVARQVRQMVQLVDDLMDMSRMVQGKVRLSPEPLDLARVVADTAESLRVRAADRGIRVETIAPDRPVWVTADPTRLDQVLANLLSNALKYCDRGDAIMLWVDEEADRAAIHIRDTGAGIAAETLPVLFELFSQGGPPVDRTQGGLGIGLHLVKQLVELHGGTVEAYSEGPNRGSEFVIRLPLRKPPGEPVLPSPRTGE